MFAKKPNPDSFDVERPNNPKNLTTCDPATESHSRVAPEELAQIGNAPRSDRAKLLIFPSQPSRTQPTWLDYEEVFPTTEDEATTTLDELTSAVINRRCYYQQYWPKNTVFRIKDIDVENHTVYLNLIYRWVSAAQVRLLENIMPQRPPQGLECDYLVDEDDCSDF